MEYAPTTTMIYQQCPQLYAYRKSWVPKDSIVGWTPNRLLGTAIAKGLEIYYTRLKSCSLGDKVSQVDIDDAYEAALEVLNTYYQEGTEWTIEGLSTLVTAGLKAALKTGFPLGGEIIAVEEKLDQETPDLVYRSQDGEVVIIDHKVVLKLSPDYVESRLLTYDTSWQLAHYAWKWGQKTGEFVARTGVHLITLSPKIRAFTHFTPRWTPAKLAMWASDAERVWADMEGAQQSGQYRRNWGHCQAYGTTPERRCEMFTLCHELDGDESRVEVFYERKGKAPVQSND